MLTVANSLKHILLCDDVILRDIGLLLLIIINTMLFSVDNKHLINVLREEKQYEYCARVS